MAEQAISAVDLSYRYRGQERNALSEVSFTLAAGEALAVMGPSAAGKSTLAAATNGLIPHFFHGRFGGDLVVRGRNTRAHTVATLAADVGLVFQDFEAQIFSTTVELEVAFGPENLGVPRPEMAARVAACLDLVGMRDLRKRIPSTLSGGQKQKLAIAAVLAMQPRVLVMDEPTTDLDPLSKSGILAIADRLRAQGALSLLVVEHETEEMQRTDRILLLKAGRALLYGPTAEVLRAVGTLRDAGVMPLGVTEFFHALDAPLLPLTPAEGWRHFAANGWHVDAAAAARLAAQDRARSAGKGAVLIRCSGLEHVYPDGHQALRGVDLEIRRGEILAVIGQNGSGKTTLVKHFNGLLTPTAGEVTVNGASTRGQGALKLGQTVGYVFQNPDHQIFCNTVFDEVAYTLRLRRHTATDIRDRVRAALAAVHLEGMEHEDPFSLTKGARQRVAVAAVLAAGPEILILDEPTTGLDYAEQRSMLDLVRRLNSAGSTIVFVTHHMWVVAEYAERAVVVKDGRILLQGSTREVLAREDELNAACLRPPQIVRFANGLRCPALSVAELLGCVSQERSYCSGSQETEFGSQNADI